MNLEDKTFHLKDSYEFGSDGMDCRDAYHTGDFSLNEENGVLTFH